MLINRRNYYTTVMYHYGLYKGSHMTQRVTKILKDLLVTNSL